MFRWRGPIEQKFRVSFDDHQEIIEIMGYSARQASHRLHFLRLAELLFELMALADVLRHDQAHAPSGGFQFVRNAFHLDDLAVLLAMLRIAGSQTAARDLR